MLSRMVALASVLTAVVFENLSTRSTVPDLPPLPREPRRVRRGKGRKRRTA